MPGPAAAPDRAAFLAGLDAELNGYIALCELLRAEQNSLEQGDVEQLEKLTERKAQQVERLGGLGAARAAYLQGEKLSEGPQGMEEWLRSRAAAQRQVVSRTWKRLLEAAAQARNLNDLNGVLVATRLNHGQAALAALYAAGRQQIVYGPDGQGDFRAANRELGRA